MQAGSSERHVDERNDFVAGMKERNAEAERALLNGEPELYMAMWSTRDSGRDGSHGFAMSPRADGMG